MLEEAYVGIYDRDRKERERERERYQELGGSVAEERSEEFRRILILELRTLFRLTSKAQAHVSSASIAVTEMKQSEWEWEWGFGINAKISPISSLFNIK